MSRPQLELSRLLLGICRRAVEQKHFVVVIVWCCYKGLEMERKTKEKMDGLCE